MDTGEKNGERRSSSPPEEQAMGPKERSGLFSLDIFELWLEKRFSQGADDPYTTDNTASTDESAAENQGQEKGEEHGSSN